VNGLFTSESVTEGHPDKVADQISDAILDACLEQDPKARVACETLVAPGRVVLAGEITTSAQIDRDAIVRKTLARIGYDDPTLGFDAEHVTVTDHIGEQSAEIAAGVDRSLEARSDRYDEGHPVAVERIVVSAHHSPELGRAELHDALRTNVVAPVVSERLLCGSDLDGVLMVNPAGPFTLGGPAADAGLTGRKIVVDTYGGMAPHGGGAFSGKDPSKVDRSAAYGARHVARTVVAAGLASRCLVQIAFAIGAAEPVSLLLDTFGTGRLDDRSLAKLVRQVFDLRPGAFRRALDLHPDGHFGRRDLDLPWEREDRVADLRQAAQS
jgi:S-adenosylmethionine synthetase